MTRWTAVCALADLDPERGVTALVEGRQVAVFRLADDRVLAVQQKDPYSGANVLSRGIVGSAGDVATVTSPMYKQVWSLESGTCLDPGGKPAHDLVVFPARVDDGRVLVAAP